MIMDRHTVTKGMYNLFDNCIRVDNLLDLPVFYHEYYHHIQNVSTILGGQRLNLLIQFLANTRTIADTDIPLKLPLNSWYEEELKNGFSNDTLSDRLKRLTAYQDNWMSLDKIVYETYFFEKQECYDDFIALRPDSDGDTYEVYIVKEKFDDFKGYPVGGFTISESGAYALELWQAHNFDSNVLKNLSDENYQYLIILDMIYRWVQDFEIACLATFLFCDLALVISIPALGFINLYQDAKKIIKKGIQESELLEWYEATYAKFTNDINEEVSNISNLIQDIRTKKKGLHNVLDDMIEWQLKMMEQGLNFRINKKLEITAKLLSSKEEDLDYLMLHLPPSVIEITEDGENIYGNEEFEDNHLLLNATYHLYLGLCRDVNILFDNPEIKNIKRISETEFMFFLSEHEEEADAYYFILHSLGLVNKPITIIK